MCVRVCASANLRDATDSLVGCVCIVRNPTAWLGRVHVFPVNILVGCAVCMYYCKGSSGLFRWVSRCGCTPPVQSG